MTIVRPVDAQFWWEVAESCEYATFFHSPLWHQLICNTYEDKEDATIGAVCEDGTRLVLPLIKTGSAVGDTIRKLSSTFAGCYGGIIADGPVTEEDQYKVYQEAQSWNVASMQVNGNPLWRAFDVSSALSKNKANDDFTQIIDLKDRSFDEIISEFSRGHKSSMKKGRREGVAIRKAKTLEDYKAYFGAYEDCLRRWGDDASSVYPWALFENGFALAQEYPEHIALWLAEIEGQVIGGAWIFCWNQHVDYWHGATYEEFFDYRSNNVLHPAIIKDVMGRGYRFYDFNPSGGHDGVVSFKERFGANKWPLKRWRIEDSRLQMIRKVRDLF